MKIFVTGGTGFIGIYLVNKLKKGNEVIVFKGDLRNYDDIEKEISDCEYVYHLGAILNSNAPEINDVNVNGTLNLLKVCLHSSVKRILFVSTSALFGCTQDKDILINENSKIKANDGYTKSKKLGEELMSEYANKLDIVTVSPCWVFGAGHSSDVIKNVESGRIRFAFPGGTSFINVNDAVDGMITAMEKGQKGEKYILSSGYISYYDVYNTIAKQFNKKIWFTLPRFTYPLVHLLKKNFVAWAYNHRNFDTAKIKKLGWKPKYSYEETIKQAVADYERKK